jgi:foldase protein PrsA
MVNPNDPICVINGEVVTRQQLADECVARRGEEILDALIARKLIEQALKKNNMEVTAAEIEAEIDHVAMTLAHTDRETWLRTLAKDRNISPAQYARDIIFPQLALRKLAKPRVAVTDQDIKDAFESQYGEQLEYRMIVTDKLQHANNLFTELQKNPGSFEHVARNDIRSIDPTTKPAGGKPLEFMRRHSYPREATDRIFRQLVDGDPGDKDDSHKPKDGAISGPIQIAEGAWVIVKREKLHPGQPMDINNPSVREGLKNAIIESKMQQHMEAVMGELVAASAIENRLKGTVKVANQDVPAPAPQLQAKLGEKARQQKELEQSIAPPNTAKTDAAVTATKAAASVPQRKSANVPGLTDQDLKDRDVLLNNPTTPPPAYDPSKDPEKQPQSSSKQ